MEEPSKTEPQALLLYFLKYRHYYNFYKTATLPRL